MQFKPFALGGRIEHPQALIDSPSTVAGTVR